jgi:AcrR family transcriptional regulator
MSNPRISKHDKPSCYACQSNFEDSVKNKDSAQPTKPKQPQPRLIPVQQRSRERLEQILEIVTDLITEKGSDALKMSEVAKLAGISIGSLYQYFPDKASIIATLAERYNALGRACAAKELTAVSTERELQPALNRVIDGFYHMYLRYPVMRDIWGATLADKALQELEAIDGQTHTDILLEVLEKLRPNHKKVNLESLAMLTTQLIASTVRLAIMQEDKQGKAIIATFKRLLPKNLLETLEVQS